MDVIAWKIRTMKNINAKRIENDRNIFYKSFYFNKAEYRIYRKDNKFKIFVFHNKLTHWICIGKFENPRLAKREVDYIISGKKAEDIRKWFNCSELKVVYELKQ